MGGLRRAGELLRADSHTDPKWAQVYAEMDVIQRWTVGRYRTLDAVDQWKDEVLVTDLKLTASAAPDLHACCVSWIFLAQPEERREREPDSAASRRVPRRQAYNAKTAGARVLKIAMFDQVDDGTAIMKAAAHRGDAPDQVIG